MPSPSHHHRRLRARPDLQYVPQEGTGGDRYAVKDPVSLEYFYLRRREYFLLRELATPRTLRELRTAYQRRFPAERITHDELLAFCSAMHDCSLLMPTGPGQATVLEQRASGGGGVMRWFSPLAIRLPGIDPTPLLEPLGFIGRVLLTRAALMLLVAVATIVCLLLLGQIDRLLDNLATLAELWNPEYAGAAVLALLLMKSWHEIGHGLAVRRFGGECHEMGVLLLVFVPCLYCDASDAWSFRSRRQRAVVALAGIYFELLAATIAAALWLVLAPGLLASLALYAAVIGTALTLLVNLNPLMRFDGYYLLSDAWGVANLHSESRRALWGPILSWIRGTGPDRQPFDAPQWRLAAFAAASTVHLLVVMTTILWVVHRGLDAVGLRLIGDLLVGTTVLGLIGQLLRSVASGLQGPKFGSRLRPPLRMAALLGLATAAGWFVLGIPFEQSLRSPCRLESVTAANIAAPAAGELIRLVAYESQVAPGDPLARVADPQLEFVLLAQYEKEAALAAQLTGLQTRAGRDAKLFSAISLIETQLAETRRQRRTLERRRQRMTLHAPIAGRVTRPPPPPAATPGIRPTLAKPGQMLRWTTPTGGAVSNRATCCVCSWIRSCMR